jgi:hypothetical protein
MKKPKKEQKPSRSQYSVLRQICNFIPTFLVPQLARQTNAQDKSRTFSPWSHVVAMIFAQIAHSLSLFDVCDALRLHRGLLSALRGATPPSKNGLSHANQERDAALAENLFWQVLEHLQSLAPGFGRGGRPRYAFRFKRLIQVVDSTTIQLVVRCMNWAKHRRRKAAAKCHLRLDLQSWLPRFVLVGTAKDNDNKRAREVCAGLRAGEIVIFDKAYVDLAHLFDLFLRQVSWVTRAKDHMQFRVIRCLQRGPVGNIVRDDLVRMKSPISQERYPEWLRRVVAWVEVDGQWRLMTFLSDNLEWSAQSIVDLYRCRWSIEVFFKELKQSLQLVDFLGYSANAVKWQVWIALLVYVLLRFQAYLSRWGHSFLRLFALVRSALWEKLEVRSLLELYGTAAGGGKYRAAPQQAYLPGFG